MSFALPVLKAVAGPLIGAGFSALGGSGKQAGQKTNSIQDLTENTRSDTDQTRSGTTTTNSNQQLVDTQDQRTSGSQIGIEDPFASLFRYGLFGNLNKEISRAQTTPVFTDAHKAQFLNQLNDVSNLSMKSLSGNLARHGALNSGAFAQGASDIETNRFGQLANFYAGLPFQEEAARSTRVQPLFGIASSLAGHAPTSTLATGESSGTRNATTTGASTTESNERLTGSTTGSGTRHGTSLNDIIGTGPGFLSGFLSQIGQGLGNGAFGNLGGIFGKKN
jgi:hypothetical protein